MKKLILLAALILASCSTPVGEESITPVDSCAVECVDTCAKIIDTCTVTTDDSLLRK